MTMGKETGGLGFWELETFNLDLLTKMADIVLKELNSLCVGVLKGIYFPRGEFLSARKGGRVSGGWSSILCVRDTLKKEGLWRIGNKATVHVFNEPWLHTKAGFRMEPTNQAAE